MRRPAATPTLALLACVLLSLAWRPLPRPVSSAPATTALPPPKVSPQAWQAAGTAGGADVIVSALGYPVLVAAQQLATKQAKTQYVAVALLRYADQAQADLRRDLALRHVPYHVLWLINSLAVPAVSRDTLAWLASRPDVSHIDLDVKSRGIEAQTSIVNHQSSISSLQPPVAISPGVSRVNAPDVWALGYRGQGIVIADLDTGVQWDHPALQPQFRGWDGVTVTFDTNWFDPTGESVAAATDDNGHGTHTTGTLVGDDGAGADTGVAPGAKWIACRNMLLGTGSVSRYIACFQFAMAPTDVYGNNPNPTLAADITSNSWSCWGTAPWYEQGCLQPDALLTATLALRSAGIMVVAAAGNEGPTCGTVGHAPGSYPRVLAIGATNLDAQNSIASFSSRGPSAYDGGLKPNLVAPGVDIYSTLPTNAYGYDSGTSMATPHVAGTVALLWSAAPGLRGDVDETEAILLRTTQPLTTTEECGSVPGTDVPNNTYGYGLVDAQAAVSEALAIVPDVWLSTLQSVDQPLTLTMALTNSSSITRSSVIASLQLPTPYLLVSNPDDGLLAGAGITWSIGNVNPGQDISVTVVIKPQQAGLVAITPTITYDGLLSMRFVPGHAHRILVYAVRLWSPSVMHN